MPLSIESFATRFNPRRERTGEFTRGPIKQFGFNSDEVESAPFQLVWTAIDADGKQFLVPGFHRVNRLYYVLCTEAWTRDNIEVRL